MADTGISPGSGVGNKRMSLSKDTLGVPVIAVGVPTVVDAATIASDAIDLLLENAANQNGESNRFYDAFKNMAQAEKFNWIQEVLSPYVGNLMVTPKEIDEVIDNIAGIIANGINIALHESIGLKDVDRFLN
jgi:spore protease